MNKLNGRNSSFWEKSGWGFLIGALSALSLQL
jgi:hypothetical protein